MEQSKTRFDAVSKGMGMFAGGGVCLVLGLLFAAVGASFGFTLLGLSAVFIGLGVYRVKLGVEAPTKRVKCPTCQAENEVLRDVKEFPCKNCGKSIYLKRRRS